MKFNDDSPGVTLHRSELAALAMCASTDPMRMKRGATKSPAKKASGKKGRTKR